MSTARKLGRRFTSWPLLAALGLCLTFVLPALAVAEPAVLGPAPATQPAAPPAETAPAPEGEAQPAPAEEVPAPAEETPPPAENPGPVDQAPPPAEDGGASEAPAPPPSEQPPVAEAPPAPSGEVTPLPGAPAEPIRIAPAMPVAPDAPRIVETIKLPPMPEPTAAPAPGTPELTPAVVKDRPDAPAPAVVAPGLTETPAATGSPAEPRETMDAGSAAFAISGALPSLREGPMAPAPPAATTIDDSTPAAFDAEALAGPRLVAPFGAAPTGSSSLLAVLAGYVLPGSGAPPTTLILLVLVGMLLAALYSPRPQLSERVVALGLLAPRSGHGKAVCRPG